MKLNLTIATCGSHVRKFFDTHQITCTSHDEEKSAKYQAISAILAKAIPYYDEKFRQKKLTELQVQPIIEVLTVMKQQKESIDVELLLSLNEYAFNKEILRNWIQQEVKLE
jgi:hypothetical protein